MLNQDELDAYELIFSFWSQLGQLEITDSGHALINLEVPFYLSNAIWYPNSENFDPIQAYYKAKQLPPAVIISNEKSKQLEPLLHQHAFQYKRSFQLRKANSTLTSHHDIHVEQVSWSLMRYAAELIANHYEQPDLLHSLSKQLTHLLQTDQKATAYLAYQNEAAGAMISYESKNHTTAMLLVDVEGQLEHRLAQDAIQLNKQALILEALSPGVTESSHYIIERWSIPQEELTE